MKNIVLLLSLGVLAFYLITEHKAHLYGALPYILFGVFILSHLFMHGGHGGHNDSKKGGHHGK